MAITLLQHIQKLNTDARDRMAKNQHLWIGMLTEDISHWNENGVMTPEDLDEYLDHCVQQEREEETIYD